MIPPIPNSFVSLQLSVWPERTKLYQTQQTIQAIITDGSQSKLLIKHNQKLDQGFYKKGSICTKYYTKKICHMNFSYLHKKLLNIRGWHIIFYSIIGDFQNNVKWNFYIFLCKYIFNSYKIATSSKYWVIEIKNSTTEKYKKCINNKTINIHEANNNLKNIIP